MTAPASAAYALYDDADSAQRAVDRLRAAGVPDSRIVIVSSEPFEEYEFAQRDRLTWMYWIAGGGGVLGLAAGTFLTTYTETAWPLPTGGMPIVAWWPNLVVMFELTMLGAILSAVATLVVTAGLARRRPRLYDPEVVDGKILVGVSEPEPPAVSAVERALASVGGATVRHL